MLILYCTDPLEKFVRILKILITFMHISVPILLIVATIFYLYNVVYLRKEKYVKKNHSTFIKRVIILMLFIIIPNFTLFTIRISSGSERVNSFFSCYQNIKLFIKDKKPIEEVLSKPSECTYIVKDGITFIRTTSYQDIYKYIYKYDTNTKPTKSSTIEIVGEFNDISVEVQGKIEFENIKCIKESN